MTKEKKTNLVQIPNTELACPHVIKQLEELLEAANEGKIKNMFIVAEIRNDDPMFVQVGVNEPIKTLGLLAWAQTRWIETALVAYEDDDAI